MLSLSPSPFTLKGTIAMEKSGPIPRNVSVALSGMDQHLHVYLKPDQDGHFEAALPADHYQLEVQDADVPMYVKSVTLDQQNIAPSAIELSSPDNRLQIVLSDQGAEIDGAATNGEQQPLVHGLALAIGQDGRSYLSSLDNNGAFSFKALEPESYRVLCFTDLDSQAELTPDIFQKVEDEGESISVGPTERRIMKIRAAQID